MDHLQQIKAAESCCCCCCCCCCWCCGCCGFRSLLNPKETTPLQDPETRLAIRLSPCTREEQMDRLNFQSNNRASAPANAETRLATRNNLLYQGKAGGPPTACIRCWSPKTSGPQICLQHQQTENEDPPKRGRSGHDAAKLKGSAPQLNPRISLRNTAQTESPHFPPVEEKTKKIRYRQPRSVGRHPLKEEEGTDRRCRRGREVAVGILPASPPQTRRLG